MGMEMFNGRPYGGVDPNGIHWSDAKTSVKKNLLINERSGSFTSNGITFTINEDKSISISGTATATTYFNFWVYPYQNYIPNGDYIISQVGCNSNVKAFINKYLNETWVSALVSSFYAESEKSFTVAYDNTYNKLQVGLAITNGATVDTTVKVMIRFASIGDNTYVPYVFDNVELKEEIDNSNKSTTLAVDLTNWTQDATSQSGSTLYKKQISLNHVYTDRPSVDIGAASGSVLPTTAEQTAYDLIQYVTVDSAVPCLYLYASDIPTTAFYINVIGVD